jgi:hypothetical protein
MSLKLGFRIVDVVVNVDGDGDGRGRSATEVDDEWLTDQVASPTRSPSPTTSTTTSTTTRSLQLEIVGTLGPPRRDPRCVSSCSSDVIDHQSQ